MRAEFLLSREYIHMALMLLASHPRPVREAIERHRRGLDENPVAYGLANFQKLEDAVRAAAADYTGGKPDEIALTGNTTTGLALLYGGLPLRPRQEIVATTHDHYVTYEALRLRALHTGAAVRKVPLYAVPEKATADEIVGNLVKGIGPRTRAVACTWVHSSTGVKLPIRRMADALADVNKKRAEADRVLLCVDGVHGFGVEQESFADLGCDFFVAGCHKWIFGPRGTGMVWGKRRRVEGAPGHHPDLRMGGVRAVDEGQDARVAAAGAARLAGRLPRVRAPLGAGRGVPLPPRDRQAARHGAHPRAGDALQAGAGRDRRQGEAAHADGRGAVVRHQLLRDRRPAAEEDRRAACSRRRSSPATAPTRRRTRA